MSFNIRPTRGALGDTPMNFDLLLRFVSLPIAAAAASSPLSDFLGAGRSKLREEYRFAKDFFVDLRDQPDMHPFQRQKGLQALAGDSTLDVSTIEYLLTLDDPLRALKDFSLGRQYLQRSAIADGPQVIFARRYESSRSRGWRKWLYFALYVASLFAALWPPFLLAVRALPFDQYVKVVSALLVIGLPSAFFSLRAAVKINRAEALVHNQDRDPVPG